MSRHLVEGEGDEKGMPWVNREERDVRDLLLGRESSEAGKDDCIKAPTTQVPPFGSR